MNIHESPTNVLANAASKPHDLVGALRLGSDAASPQTTQVNSLLPPRGRHPYYIVTPRYVRTSAGIRCMHLLCHWLNRIGHSAYVLIDPFWDGLETNPELITPVLNRFIVDAHFEASICPIVFCAETYEGSEFDTALKVRFLGNYPGHLGGPSRFRSDELIFGYSQHLAHLIGYPDNVLHIPSVNAQIFYPDPSIKRSGSCFYAAKFQDVHGGKVFGLPENCFEIVRDRPDQLTQEQLADLFRRSEILYVFEDTSIANEAAMCGCPVVLMPNEHFSRPLAIEEVGWDGYAWGPEENEVERARTSVGKVYENYQRNFAAFFEQLDKFVEKTQYRARQINYSKKISLKSNGIATRNVERSSDDNQTIISVLRAQLDEARLSLAETGTNGVGNLMWLPPLGAGEPGSRVLFVVGWNDAGKGMSLGEIDGLIKVMPPRGAAWIRVEVIVEEEGQSYSVYASQVRQPILITGPAGRVVTIDIPVLNDIVALDIRFSVQAQHGIPSIDSNRENIIVQRIASIPSSIIDRGGADWLRSYPSQVAARRVDAQTVENELEDQLHRIDRCIRLLKLRSSVLAKLELAEAALKARPQVLPDFTGSWTISENQLQPPAEAMGYLGRLVARIKGSQRDVRERDSELRLPSTYAATPSDLQYSQCISRQQLSTPVSRKRGRSSGVAAFGHSEQQSIDAADAAPLRFKVSQDWNHLIKEVLNSELFDADYYRATYPDAGLLNDHEALVHFVRKGMAQGRNPHPLFSTLWYVKHHDSSNALAPEPFIDFLKRGGQASSHPLFDGTYYAEHNSDVVASGLNCLAHYMKHGAVEMRSPHPAFDPDWYTRARGRSNMISENPLIDYLTDERAFEVAPCLLFDPAEYSASFPDRLAGTNPLIHYLEVGHVEAKNPHYIFNTAWYLGVNPDVASSHHHPFVHFLRWGRYEHRNTHPLFDSDHYRMQIEPEEMGCDYITHYLTLGIRRGLVPSSHISAGTFQEIFPAFSVRSSEYIKVLLSDSAINVEVRRRPVDMHISEVES